MPAGMEEDRIRHILDNYRKGRITDEELAFLESWYLRYREAGAGDYGEEQLLEDSRLVKDGLLRDILPVSRKRRFLPVAAAIAVVLAAGLYFYLDGPAPGGSHSLAEGNIHPGGNKATLTLAEGNTIDLSTEKDGIVVREGDFYYNDGSVIDHTPLPDSVIRYALLSTPRGGQYQLQLSDGTKVWLNAHSSLKYPVSFDGLKERRVMLEGEAYFEVARDTGKPFIVATSLQRTEVLGTSFNIKSYPGQQTARTTLLEGSLRVASSGEDAPAGNDGKLLRPGQQAVVSPDRIDVKDVDPEEAVAWKNGYFQFNNKDLETAMTEVARWYDIDVEYGNDRIRTMKLAGTISKYASIAQVLEKMELTGMLQFRITGRKVLVE